MILQVIKQKKNIAKGILLYLMIQRKLFQTTWFPFYWRKKTRHPARLRVDRLGQIREGGDVKCFRVQRRYVLKRVALFSCVCEYSTRNVLTFLKCDLCVMHDVSVPFAMRHSRDTHVAAIFPLDVSRLITESRLSPCWGHALNYSLKRIRSEHFHFNLDFLHTPESRNLPNANCMIM